jgi:antitoxin CcdA
MRVNMRKTRIHCDGLMLYDKNAPQRAVNLSVNSDLAAKAKSLGVNLSEALEGKLAELVATRYP